VAPAPAIDDEPTPPKKKTKKKKKPAPKPAEEAPAEEQEASGAVAATDIHDPPLVSFGAEPVEEPLPEEEPAAVADPAPETVAPEPTAEIQAAPAPALPLDEPNALSGAFPILAGLLALAAILLGLAAMPGRITTNAVASVLTARRLELCLIGAAVLASAAIGLVLTVLAA
jgi:hypothetical protein